MRKTASHKRGGTTRLLVGFAVGTLATVLAVRYVPVLRDAALVDVNGSERPATAPPERGNSADVAAAESGKSPAFRMSYELSRVPPEVPVTGERVVNARPISPVPPDPRDRTREIQKEAQNPQYRDVPQSPGASAGKVFEGRDVVIKPKPPEAPPRAAVPATGATGGPPQLNTPTAEEQGAAPPKPVEPETRGSAQSNAVDPVESRFRTTREWLTGAPQTTHTIQLLGTPSEAQLKIHLLALSKMLEPGKLYVFRTVAQGKPSITVAYGAYPDRKSALEALDGLPAPAATYRPVLRTVNGIRAELKQHGLE